MNSLLRRSLSAAAGVATLATASLALAPTSAHAATSPFLSSTSTRVPAGWSIVDTAPRPSAAGTVSGVGMVYEVGPSGAQRALLRIPASENIADVSANGQRISTIGGADKPTVTVYDLATHRVSSFASASTEARFTNPSGANLYVWNRPDGSRMVERVDLAGHVLARFPGATEAGFVATTDGRLLWGTHDNAVTLSSNATGRVVRTIATPRGFEECFPLHDWDATGVVASCWRPMTSGAQTFIMRTDGTTTPLTASLPGRQGYMNAWLSSAGLVARETSYCGPTPSVLQVGRGVRTIPLAMVTDVLGNSAYGLTPDSCGEPQPVFERVDLPSMRVHRLLTPAAGREITQVITNDITRGSNN